MSAAPSSVLLLGWDATSAALPLAQALSATTATTLWTAQALPADAPAHTSLDVAPPLPTLPRPGHAVPAFPYVGQGVGLPAVAVPAAPYVGRTEPGTGRRPASPLPTNEADPGRRPLAVPAAPYVGATHAPTETYAPALPPYPAAWTVPAPATSAIGPSLPPPTGPLRRTRLTAAHPPTPSPIEPGPAEAAELASETPAPALSQPLPTEPAPLPPAEAQPELPAPTDDTELNAQDLDLLTAAPDLAALNFRIIQYARHAARLAHEVPFEVIFAPDWTTWLAGVELRQLTRRPLVLRVEQLATDVAVPAERGWIEALERLTLTQADRILVPDEATAAHLRQRYQLPAQRLHVLPADATPDLRAALVLNYHATR